MICLGPTMGTAQSPSESKKGPISRQGFVGSEIQVTTDGKDQDQCSAAHGGANFFVVFRHRYSSTDGDIHAQLVKNDGSLGYSAIVDQSTSDSHAPEVAYCDWAGRFLVVWASTPPSPTATSPHEIWGQLHEEAGPAVGSPFRISPSGAKTDFPCVAPVAGGFLVAYEYDILPGDTGIAATHVSFDGAVGTQNVVAGPDISHPIHNYFRHPEMASEGTSATRCVVVWEYHRLLLPMPIDVRSVAVDQSGSAIGTPITVAEGSTYPMVEPDIAWSGNTSDGFLVVWERQHLTFDHDILGAWLNPVPPNDPVTTPMVHILVADDATSNCQPTAAWMFPNMLACWSHYLGSPSNDWDLFGVRVGEIAPIGADQRITYSLQTEKSPCIAVGHGGRIGLYCWEDSRNGNLDIYALLRAESARAPNWQRYR